MVKVSVDPFRMPESEPLTARSVLVSRPAMEPLTELPDCVKLNVAVPGPLESDRLPDHLPVRLNADVPEVGVGELGLSLPHAETERRLTQTAASRRRMVGSFRVER